MTMRGHLRAKQNYIDSNLELPFFLSCRGLSASVGSDTERTFRLTGENTSVAKYSG